MRQTDSIAAGAAARVLLRLSAALLLVPSPALGQPDVDTATGFDAAEPGRSYMDVGGVWDGSTDISLGPSRAGDGFSATLTNLDSSGEAAANLGLVIDLPPGFMYQDANPLGVSLVGAGCGPTPTVTVTDNGSSLDVDFDGATPQYDLPTDCSLTVDLELLADMDATPGVNAVGFEWSYQDAGGAAITRNASQQIQVREGAASLAVVPLTQTSSGPGDTVTWQLTVTNEGEGGLFAVEIDESAINPSTPPGLDLNPPISVNTAPRTVSIPDPPGDVATIPYLDADESLVIDAAADVQSCDNLNNEVVSRHKVLVDPLSVTAEVLLDLGTPQLDYTPISGNLDYTGPTSFTLPVSNNGDGTAFGVELQTNLENGGPAVNVVSAGPAGEWEYAGAGLFRYIGDQGAGSGNIPAGASAPDLEITLEPADVCTDGGGGTIEYQPRYDNVCGTSFSSPTDTGGIGGPDRVPGIGVTKSASPALLAIGSGDPGSYTVGFSASETDLIGDGTAGDGTPNGPFTVTDTLPAELNGPVSVTPSGGSVSCPGGSCDPGEQITWTIPNPGDGSNVSETLGVDFTAPDDACLGGTTLTNTANALAAESVDPPACTIAGESGSAGNQLSNSPIPRSDAFTVTGGPFESGQPDDGDCSQATGEGECIPHEVNYEFPSPYPGVWSDSDGNSTFTDDFGGIAGQQVVADSVEVELREDGSVITAGFEDVPNSAIVQGTGQLVLDLAFLSGSDFFGDNNVGSSTATRAIRLRYDTTVPDSAVLPGDSLTVGATSELLIKDGQGGSGACEGELADPNDVTFRAPTSFTVERAVAEVDVTRTDGTSTADVCEVMPVRIDAGNGNDQQAADLLTQLLTDGSDYTHLDPPAPVYGGQFDASFLDYDPSASGGPTWEFNDPEAELTSGTIDVEVRLEPGAPTGFGAGTPLTAEVGYDDNETTLEPPVGGSPTDDRAFTTSGSFTPSQVRAGELTLQTTPQQRFVTGDRVGWTIFVVNGGSGAAYNVRVVNDLADELGVNLGATQSATPSCGGDTWDIANPGGTDNLVFTIDEVPAATTCRLELVANVPTTTGCSIPNDGPESNRIAGEWGCGNEFVQQGSLDGPYTDPLADDSPDFVFAEPSLRLKHEVSFCNLCDPVSPGAGSGSFDANDGTVRLQVRNNGQSRIQDVEVTEILPVGEAIDLVPGTVEYRVGDTGSWTATSDPVETSPGSGEYVFSSTQIPEFQELFTPSESGLGPVEIQIRYNISSNESTRTDAPHPIVVSGEGDRPCDGETFDFGPRTDQIEVREPNITVEKTGVNLTNDRTGDPELVVGTPNERIRWIIEITNNGDHNTRQTRLRDILVGQVNRTTASPGLDDSNIVLDGPGLAGGINISDAEEEDYFGLPTIAPDETVTYTLEETLGGDCFNTDNQADLTWGCRAEAQGEPSNLDVPGDPVDTARLLMVPDFSADDAIQQSFTVEQGGRTRVTLTLRNDGAPANDMVVRNDLPDGLRIDLSQSPSVQVSGTQSLDSVDISSAGTNGQPGSPNHPRIELNGQLGFGQTTTVTFWAIQAAGFDDRDDPFADPETNGGASPDPVAPGAGPNSVFIEFAAAAACDSVTPPQRTDQETLDPRIPDLDFAAGGPANPRIVADEDTATFDFTVRNNGPPGSRAAPAEFRLDALGGGWSGVSVEVVSTQGTGTGGTCAGSFPFNCAASLIGELGAGEEAVVRVEAQANDNGSPLTLIGELEGSVIEKSGNDTTNDFSRDRQRAIAVGFELSKTLASTTEPYTGNPEEEVAVGEDATFDLRARWFGLDTAAGEAVTGIALRDRLDPASGRIGFVTKTDSTMDGASIASSSTPTPVTSGTIDWTLDDITSDGAGTFTSDLTTRLLNIAATSKGDTATNRLDATFSVDLGGATFDFASGEFGGSDGELAASDGLDIVEPSVVFNKAVRNITRGTGFQDADPPNRLEAEGNDRLQYRVTVRNTATGTADAPVFGLIVDDLFQTDQIRIDGSTVGADTDGDDRVDVSCSGALNPGPPDQVLFDADNCDFLSPGRNLVRLDPGETVTLLYEGTVEGTVNPEEVADNGADLTDAWSLSGRPDHQGNQTSGFEGTKGDSDGARNYPGSDLAGVVVENDTAISKTVLAGDPSFTSPLSAGADGEPNLRVGDGLRYEVVVSLAPESTIENFTISDALPPGFAFTGDVSDFSFDDVTASTPDPADPSAGDTSHTWDFGTVTVSDKDNDGTTTPEIRFDYAAVTRDAGPNAIEAPGASLDEENAATVEFDTGGGGSGTFSATAVAPVDVVQPQLQAGKSASPSPPDRVGENETVTYTITLTNNGGGPAYDPVVEDIIPQGMRGDGIAGITTQSISVAGGPPTTCDPVDVGGDFGTTSGDAGGDVRWILDGSTGGCSDDYTIGAGESLELVYTIEVNDDIGADLPLFNAASAPTWFSFDDDAVPGSPGATTVPERREYGPSNTATVNLRSSEPGNLSKTNPSPATATIGETFVYTIQVPADPGSLDVSIFDTVVTDDLPEAVTFVSLDTTLDGGATGSPTVSFPSPNTLEIADSTDGVDIPPGGSVVYEVEVRVDNTTNEDAGDTFTNTARYVFSSDDDDGTQENSGGPDVTTPAVTILEPLVTPTKAARNVTEGDAFGGAFTAPDAGDIVEYCLRLPENRATAASAAFDLDLRDTLPPDAQYQSGSTQLADGSCQPGNAPGNTLGEPTVSGQTLTWSRAANDVDVDPGTTVAVLYRVALRDALEPLTALSNDAIVEWTSLDGSDANERTFDSATNPPNDYRATTSASFDSADTTQLAKTEISTPPLGDGGDGDGDYRLGERVTYRVALTDLTEGTLEDFTITDTLPEGLAYESGSATITQGGGISPDPGATPEPDTVAGSGAVGDPQTLIWDFDTVVNDGEAPDGTTADTLTLEYSALVRDDAPATEDARNGVTVRYLDAGDGALERTDDTTIDIVVPAFQDPDKSTTAPTPPGGTVTAGSTVPYTVELTNTGAAPGYDLVIRDTIPEGMRDAAASAGSIPATLEIVDAGGSTVEPERSITGTFPGSFASDGIVEWSIDTGGDDDRVPAGGTAILEYDVQIDSDVGPAVSLTNAAGGQEWFTIDPDASGEGTPVQRGPGPTDSVTVQTPSPGPLSKTSTTDRSTMGDTVVYRLRVPDASFGAQLFDVVITDTLPGNVEFLSADYAPTSDVSGPLSASVSGSNVLTIVSANDPDGIDIPADSVAVIDVTVRHNDAGGGVAGDTYTNGATYTWEREENGTDDLDGGPVASKTIEVIEPELIVDKTGPGTIGRAGGSFTVVAENIGRATAHDAVITDVLPPEMRDTRPVIDSVEIAGPSGTRSLAEGSDYSVSWDGGTGTLELMLESGAAALAGTSGGSAGETLTIAYTAFLDTDAPDATTLTNVAGATRYATQDGTGGSFPPDTRVYTPGLSDGTPGTADHEDVHETTTEAPVLEVTKAVDASTAIPGQTLAYSITVTNSGTGEARVDITDDFGAIDAGGDDVYAPGSLAITSAPASFGSNASDPNAGTGGKGLIDFRDVVVPAGGSASVEATIDTRDVVSDGDKALNQGNVVDRFFAISEPTDDPASVDDDDPTETVFGAEPDLRVTKRDADVTGDPDVLALGDTIEYTIRVENVGTETVTGARLTDAVPGNTRYVAGSTTLNGNPVPDAGSSGEPRSPLADGIAINDAGSPGGTLQAQSGNAAVVRFRVTVDTDLLEGTVISNQASVTAEGTGSGVVPTVPSDDPDTAIEDDPTQSIVGSAPLIDVQKTVTSSTTPVRSGPSPPSSELTYTLVVTNNGTAPATRTVLTDDLPAEVAYVAGSTTLNGVAVPDAAGGGSPLASAAGGLPISSADLVPPGSPPAAEDATLTPGESATVVFRASVADGLADGTTIANQGVVASEQQPDEPSDADGNDENGDQPTVVTVGGQPQLDVAKEVFVVDGGTVQPGGLLDYAIRVENTGAVDATNVEITDDLDAPVAGQVEYIPGSGALDGVSAPVSFSDPVVTADVGTLAAGEAAELRFRVRVDRALDAGTTIDNTGRVTAAGGVDETGSVAIDVGGAPGVANLTGRVWLDNDLDDAFDGADERALPGWRASVRFNGRTVGSVESADDGTYALRGLAPGGDYTLRFTFPGQTTTFGEAVASLGTAGRQEITDITPTAGANVTGESMPVTANGVVYDSIERTRLSGVELTLLRTSNGQPVAAGCFADSSQQGQQTAANGLYLFELEFGDPSCPSPGDYLLQLDAPDGSAPSAIIPPETDGTTAAYDVSACPEDALPPGPPGSLCEAQPRDEPPGTSVSPGDGTRYFLNLRLDASSNGDGLYNHHLPVDPGLADAITLTKSTPFENVVRGQQVPYTITATNQLGGPLPSTAIRDTMPPGFKYVEGSATVQGERVEPERDGRQLTWRDLTLPPGESFEIKMILVVGGGVGEGEYINRARARNTAAAEAASGEATATVRVVPDPTFDCTDVIGKVFDDRDADGHQDEGEPGLGGVRVTTPRGLLITTDEHGRYHVTCAAVPDRDRGSNIILKLDPRSLPSGYRATTENPRVVRATRGKMVRVNFGATGHRVVRLDLAGAAFRPASAELRPEWRGRLDTLYDKLAEAPSVLRLSYLGDTESERLARRRLSAVRERIQSTWSERDDAYDLRIETEIYWRRGSPGGDG